MKKYVIALNPDDFLYADAVSKFLESQSSRIDSICIFPSKANLKYRREHFLANLRIVGIREFLKISWVWLSRRDRTTIQAAAKKYQIPYIVMDDVNGEDFYRHLTVHKISSVLNICSQIYKKTTLDRIPPVYNYHGGYVPGNAGRFPVFWAYLKNLPQFVTCHSVSEVVDGGKPILHVPIETLPEDSVWSITERIMHRFPEIMGHSISLIDEGKSEILSLTIPEFYGPRPTKKDIMQYRDLLLHRRSRGR